MAIRPEPGSTSTERIPLPREWFELGALMAAAGLFTPPAPRGYSLGRMKSAERAEKRADKKRQRRARRAGRKAS